MRKLNVHKLVLLLNDLCDTLRSDYDINCGGCCFVAYEIAKHLDRLNIKYNLIIASYDSLYIEKVNQEISTKRINLQDSESVSGTNTRSHYYIEICGGGFVNPGSFREYSYYNNYKISNINHKNIKWIYKYGDWNDYYDCSNNQIVKKTISHYFKKWKSKLNTSHLKCLNVQGVDTL